jgi:hypothetical protein
VHLEPGQWFALVVRIATLYPRMVCSVNFDLVYRLPYVRSRVRELDDLLNIREHPVLRVWPINVDVRITEPDRGLHIMWPRCAGRQSCC